MTTSPEINTITTGYYSTTAINTNFENIKEAFETLSLSEVSYSGSYDDLTDKPTIPSGEMALMDEATTADIRALEDASAVGVTTRKLRDAVELTTPSGDYDWTPDWEDFVSASWVVTGDRALNNPTDVIPGTVRTIKVSGSDETERTITWGDNFVGNVPTQTVTSSSFYLVTMFATAETEIVVSYIGVS